MIVRPDLPECSQGLKLKKRLIGRLIRIKQALFLCAIVPHVNSLSSIQRHRERCGQCETTYLQQA